MLCYYIGIYRGNFRGVSDRQTPLAAKHSTTKGVFELSCEVTKKYFLVMQVCVLEE